MKIRGRGRGGKLLRDFIKEVGRRFNTKINAYSSHQISSRDEKRFDYAFWHHEEASKGFLTASIDEITGSNFIQEYTIKRKRKRLGRVDYHVRYEPTERGIDILVEVKQAWNSMRGNKLKPRNSLWTRLEQCYKQIKRIQHPTWCSRDNVYGVAIVIVPVYASKKENDEERSRKEIKSKKTIQAVQNATGADQVLAYRTPHEFLRRYEEEERPGKYFIPGFLMIFKTKKLSRDRN